MKSAFSKPPLEKKGETGLGLAGRHTSLGSLAPFLQRHWRRGALGALLVIASSLLLLPQPLITRYLVDDVILARRADLLLLAVLLLAGVKLAALAASALQQYFFSRFSQHILNDIQQNLLEHTLRLPKEFFDNTEVGTLVSRLSGDVEGLRWFFSSVIVNVATNFLSFLGGVVFVFYLEWRLGIAVLILLPVLVLSVRFFSRHMRRLSQHGMEQRARIMNRFQETLASMPLIKAFTAEEREHLRIMEAVRQGRELEVEQSLISSLASFVLAAVPDLARALVLIVGAVLVIRGEWTLGSILAFQSYLGYIYSPAMYLAQANLQFQNALTALERVSALYEIVPERKPGSGLKADALKGDVRFEGVSFGYRGCPAVLEAVSFHVRPGEHIAITGPSGAGKTTLASLILRFYRPTGGRIFFDDVEASQFDLESLRQRIGYVAQSPLLMAGSIRENLTYGRLAAGEAEMRQAARLAGMDDFISSLPDGYDTLVGERGVNLSEGQKQRISIARTLLKNPDILVLDEPTTSLDVHLEQSILVSLPEAFRGRTLFIISHRPGTVAQADRVLVLDGRTLAAFGTHQELLAQNAYYRSLFPTPG